VPPLPKEYIKLRELIAENTDMIIYNDKSVYLLNCVYLLGYLFIYLASIYSPMNDNGE
jgi:hypothetical protein